MSRTRGDEQGRRAVGRDEGIDRCAEAGTPGAGTPRGHEGQAAPDYDALFRELVRRANLGEPGALTRLRTFLDRNPWLWQRAGDLSAVAERSWLALICGTNQLVAESVKRRVARL